MVYVWDYFMRRKGLLLAIITVFAMGYMLSYRALTGRAEEPETSYIEIENWGEEIEVPRTGGEVRILAVMEAKDVVGLPERVEDTVEEDELKDTDDTAEVQLATVDIQNEYVELTLEEPEIKEDSEINVVLLIICGIVVLALGGYFAYQHFMR